jgi:squalene-hopene/tetraprenyl-beta-curcumene cyclase
LKKRSLPVIAACLCGVLAFPAVLPAQQPQGSAASNLSPETRQRLVESLNRGAAYLQQQRKPDGTWENNPGITGLAAIALMKMPGADQKKNLDTVRAALDSLVKLAKPDGGIYDKTVPYYVTAISVTALVMAGRPEDRPLIEKGRAYIVEHMLDEGEGVAKSDTWYGGMGYGASRPDGRRADIISLEYALQALKAADLPANHSAYDKAITFLQRTQNNSETNDQAWAANDGGFVYHPGFTYHVDGGTKSYGSATYAGVLSYLWANVKKDDPRVQAVQKWIRDNYTVDENPGLGQKTVYYYYMVFAKALQAVGEPVIVDAKGRKHNWREELGRKLISLQHPEGYWVNEVPWEMQDNKVLVTTFTMAAIQSILQ